MKKNLFLLLILCLSAYAFAQNEKDREVTLEEIQVTPPQFTGMDNYIALIEADKTRSIQKYLADHVNYPKRAETFYIEGTEVVQFVVTSRGTLEDFQIINSVSPDIDEEVIRVLKTTSGQWKPGYNSGTPMDMEKEVTVVFKTDETDFNKIMKTFTGKAEKHFQIASKNLYFKRNVKKALKHYDLGVNYIPKDKSLLVMRGLCKYELGDVEGAMKDWQRVNKLGGIKGSDGTFSDYASKARELKGYAELTRILEQP